MNWRDYITADPDILVGKPAIKGTRLSVDFILSLMEQGWTEQQLYESYPRLSPEALRAIFAYVRETITDVGLGPLNEAA